MTPTRWRVTAAAGAATVAALTIALVLIFAPDKEPQAASPGPAPAESYSEITSTPEAPPASPVSSDTEVPIDARVLPPSKPAWLEIPSIGVHTGQIVDLGLNRDNTLEVPSDAKTTGWFTQSPTPGEVGPAVLAAHVDYNHVPGPFYRLHELKPGSEAVVARGDGTSAVFVIYRVEAYPKSAFPTESVYGNTAGPELRLITCGGSFDRASRQYADNIVAYGTFERAFRR